MGQDKFEEVNIIVKGGNYGWRTMEGTHCFNPRVNCDPSGLENPIATYGRDEGVCITGGHVYRAKHSGWQGKYFFTDWSGKLFMITEQTGKTWKREAVVMENKPSGRFYINSMGQDKDGELYMLTQKRIGPYEPGAVYRILPAP